MNPKEKSLIANSGIQFLEIMVDLSDKSEAIKVSGDFAETIDEDENGDREINFEIPYYYDIANQFIERDSINPDAVMTNGQINPVKILRDYIHVIPENRVYTIRARQAIELFEGVWLPLPYFRCRPSDTAPFLEGPTSWARMWYSRIPISERQGHTNTHKIILAFDTHTSNNSDGVYQLPRPEDAGSKASIYNSFGCAVDNRFNSTFIGEDWVQTWLEVECENSRRRQQTKLTSSDEDDFVFQHIGYFLTLLKTLEKAGAFPLVQLFQTDFEPIEVALVLDLGNSRTCGLLMETTGVKKPFDFTQSRRLPIRDLSIPTKVYRDPFEMQIAFAEELFGNRDGTQLIGLNHCFSWPSLVRVGPEANRISTLNENLDGNSTMSSPKRYLWDKRESYFPWKFTNSGAMISNQGIGLQFTDDGRLKVYIDENVDLTTFKAGRPPLNINGKGREITKEDLRAGKYLVEDPAKLTPMTDPKYSRSSIMIFALAEIFLHAITYCNSYEFREQQGHKEIARKLKTVVLTCPTAMLKTEQIRLREYAEDALDALKSYFGKSFIDLDLRIIPDPLNMRQENEKRRYWAYDEATCSQLAYLYGEINDRFRRNASLYFSTIGKKINNSYFEGEPAVTLASVDIGGGTTDLMICSYQTDPKANNTVLTPQPHFWEGFNLAGDDIVRRLIERLVIPQIHLEADRLGATDTVKLMNRLFGPNIGQQTAKHRLMRKEFAVQIAVPMAQGMLQHASEERDFDRRTFDSFFFDFPRPNTNLVKYINEALENQGAKGFDLEQISWAINTQSINKVVKDVIDKMIHSLCTIISQFNCDYVLLAGRPTTLPVVRELFLRYLPVTPDCIIPMGNYRIGAWYPFADAIGVLKDPKTCVCVGASIALMSELNRLGDFSINIEKLKEVDSTADYIGKYDKNSATISEEKTFFTPQTDVATIQFDGGEMLLGMRQMALSNWIATPMYMLHYKSPTAASEIKNRNFRPPFLMEIERNPRDKESIKLPIRKIIDANGTQVNYDEFFELSLQTLVDEYGYWKDTGSFTLSIF